MRDATLARMTGRNTKLPTMPERMRREYPNRRLLDVRDVPVEQISGTLCRVGDFDHKFRPLKWHLLEKWVDTYMAFERDA